MRIGKYDWIHAKKGKSRRSGDYIYIDGVSWACTGQERPVLALAKSLGAENLVLSTSDQTYLITGDTVMIYGKSAKDLSVQILRFRLMTKPQSPIYWIGSGAIDGVKVVDINTVNSIGDDIPKPVSSKGLATYYSLVFASFMSVFLVSHYLTTQVHSEFNTTKLALNDSNIQILGAKRNIAQVQDDIASMTRGEFVIEKKPSLPKRILTFSDQLITEVSNGKPVK
ncbi:MAG: hypothetical protein WCS28_11275 [Thiomicrospira sp.]